jgi:transcriptional regulator with XRE-family HTH domain
MKTAGRPIREIVGCSPLVAALATDMVVKRKAKGVTLKDISETSHYSISTLSQATDGQTIPTPGVITAYAKALDIDPAPWHEMRSRAVKEKRGDKPEEESAAAEPPPAPPASLVSGRAGAAVAKRAAEMANTIKPPFAREDRAPVGGQAADVTTARRVQELVREAVEQSTSQLHGNPTANMLSLCTVPADLIELLRETRASSEVSIRDCVHHLRRRGIVMSSTSLQRLLQGQELPEAELLHVLLVACRVPRSEIRYWLYHRARLELARERQAQRGVAKSAQGRPAPPTSTYVSSISYKVTRSHLWSRMTTTTASVAIAVTMIVGQLLWLHWR